MKKYILSILIMIVTFNLNAQCEDNGNYWNDSWVSCTTSPSPNPLRGDMTFWLLYDFEQAQFIDTTYFWNANRTGESGWGAKDVAIDYSIDGSSWIELGVYEFPQAPEMDSYEGFLGPEFDSVFVEKILITILSTHDGGNCASIAEVQFQIDKSACYGVVDDCGICDGPGATTWYFDADMDGLGDPNNSVDDCIQPQGYVENNGDDCDNGNLGWEDMALLFIENGCTGCHNGGAAGGLDLRTYSSISSGGNICGTDLLTGTKLVDIISISNYDGCGTPISFPSMNNRVGNQVDSEELAQIQAWIDGGAPEFCSDYCLDFIVDEVVSICSGASYVFPDGVMVTDVTEDQIYNSQLISSQGCDSLIITELSVNSIYSIVTDAQICEGDTYTFPDGSVQNNITTDVQQMSMLNSINGCDSLVTTNLVVNSSYFLNEGVELCDGDTYTFPDGTTQNNISQDLSYTSNLLTVDGCDSLITTELMVTMIDTAVSVQDFTLTADAIATAYQWLDCENNFEIIPGANNQSFNVLEDGNYAVVITQNACIDTSGCHAVFSVGIDKVEKSLYGLKPNPVKEILYITGEFHQSSSLTIYNVLGQVCLVPFNENDMSFNVNDLTVGVYWLKIQVGEELHVLEFVKQR